MFIEIISLVFYMASLFLLIRLFPENATFAWFSELAYWGILLILSLLYLRFGKWRFFTT
jgi:hypothetical protein